MKISVITVCYNAETSLADTLLSVQGQSYSNIEHILIDGASSDGTVDLARKHEKNLAFWVSEPDQGIYYATVNGKLDIFPKINIEQAMEICNGSVKKRFDYLR